MPSRFLSLVIVAFWLATSAWCVVRELAPLWRAGDPPPYTIEFADEAMRNAPWSRWRLLRNGREIGSVRTVIRYSDREDTFDLLAESTRIEVLNAGPLQAAARDLKTSVRVNRDGELRGMSTSVALEVQGMTVTVEVAARVHGGRIERTCSIDSPLGKVSPVLDPVPFERGGVLNPLHPVNRVVGLQPGQTWRVPLMDPLGDAMRAAVEATVARALGGNAPTLTAPRAVQYLTAEVLPPQDYEWDRGTHSCLIIEYHGDDFTARTWVRAEDGLVLRQEARSHDEVLVLERE